MEKMFYWSNAKGLVKADHCKLEASRNPKLGFVKAAPFHSLVTLERSEGLSNLDIIPGSIIKIGETDAASGNKVVEVVGVNSLFAPLEKEAIRGDKGIVSLSNIESISKNFIQIQRNYLKTERKVGVK